MITLAFTIPNIYLFIRIWQLFISKGFGLHYTIIYFLLASIYPLSEQSGDILTSVSNYLLPFYLYLFLSVLLFDFFLLLNLIIKVFPTEARKSFRFRKYCLITLVSVSALIVIAGAVNFNTIRTTEYRIEIPKKSSGLDHLKIAFVADFHLNEKTDIGFVRRFARKIVEISPDLMLFGGDIVEGDSDDGSISEHEALMRQINTKYGVYGVLGNHEYYGGEDDGSFFRKAGIFILRDTAIVIDNSFVLAGRLDSHFSYRKSVSELMEIVVDSLPVILLDHRPTELEEASRTKADIQLSGHTHDGQMFPINLITRKVYLLSKGYRKIGNTHFFVTSGIRQWRFPVRTSGKSEIMVIDVDFK
jgi:predicted MPP superfamily phosphohydrolase